MSAGEVNPGNAAPRSRRQELAYPAVVRDEEARLLGRRRAFRGLVVSDDADKPPPIEPSATIGAAVSGGGIRSATFALGVFQALAKGPNGAEPLRRIDYLSTVSGGGYFGGFLMRLFDRRWYQRERGRVPDGEADRYDPVAVLRGAPDDRILRQLRENGRYLAPNGGGDAWLAFAIVLRNWISVQVVLSILFLGLLLALQFLRAAIGRCLPASVEVGWIVDAAPGANVWLSPWIWPACATVLLAAVPLAAAFWVFERQWQWPVGVLLGLVGVGIVALLVPGAEWVRRMGEERLGIGLIAYGALTLLFSILVMRSARSRGGDGPTNRRVSRSIERNLLSKWLRNAIRAAIVLLVVAVVDSAGGTLHAVARRAGLGAGGTGGGFSALEWFGGVAAVVSTSLALGKRVVVLFGGKGLAVRPGAFRWFASTVGGLAVAGLFLSVVSTAAHEIASGFRAPRDAKPAQVWSEPEIVRRTVESRPPGRRLVEVERRVELTQTLETEYRAIRDDLPRLDWSGLGALFLLVLAGALGRQWAFINRSSHQSFYGQRLTRAYLGASNPLRWRDQKSISDRLPNDDVSLESHYALGVYDLAAPIHLVNVTVNDTVGGRADVQQCDRRGLAVAVGPTGVHVGPRSHARFPWGETSSVDAEGLSADSRRIVGERRRRVFRALRDPQDRRGPFRDVVTFGDDRSLARFEELSLGDWTAISGAAFSTGIGSRTNIGLSLLAGFGNVRLGYWWGAEVDRTPAPCRGQRALARMWAGMFPVQRHLIREFLARFPGTEHDRWYLSDGGHFENLGGYELIRRRVKRVLVLDAEADPESTFEGLGNLVRKARIDFGAEIRFLSTDELEKVLPPEERCWIGSLEQLRARDEPEEVADGRDDDTPVALPRRRSLRHAALARVTWDDGSPDVSWLLYLKASVTGDEPLDVLRYAREHATFPHESTADQFFDEAQWESYRRLGEHIGDFLARSWSGAPAGYAAAVAAIEAADAKKAASGNRPAPKPRVAPKPTWKVANLLDPTKPLPSWKP